MTIEVRGRKSPKNLSKGSSQCFQGIFAFKFWEENDHAVLGRKRSCQIIADGALSPKTNSPRQIDRQFAKYSQICE
jgi:hypothetical protein